MKPITHYWQTINPVSFLLAPISFLFCLLVSIRRLLYKNGLLKSQSSSIPVIVVGNIYIGGNGKTPFVIWLVGQLKKAGYRPAVVSRGYGACKESHAESLAWPRQVELQRDIKWYGDEPVLIHRSAQCPVVIDPVRSHAVQYVSDTTDANVIISDDGLQHYAMSRQIEINITDSKRLYGNGLCLPAGPLREGRSRLKSVDYIVYNISRDKSQTHKSSIVGSLKINEFCMDYEFNLLKPVSSSIQKNLKLIDLKEKKVHAVAGIGDPQAFFNLLKSNGLELIEHVFSDHHQYKADDLLFDCQYPIVMTEKDAVKCSTFDLLDSWYLPIEAKVSDGLMPDIIQQLKDLKS